MKNSYFEPFENQRWEQSYTQTGMNFSRLFTYHTRERWESIENQTTLRVHWSKTLPNQKTNMKTESFSCFTLYIFKEACWSNTGSTRLIVFRSISPRHHSIACFWFPFVHDLIHSCSILRVASHFLVPETFLVPENRILAFNSRCLLFFLILSYA